MEFNKSIYSIDISPTSIKQAIMYANDYIIKNIKCSIGPVEATKLE
jgi:hypothetical protein